MKRLYLSLIFLTLTLCSHAQIPHDIEVMLDSLDALIARQDDFVAAKESRIRDVRSRIKRNAGSEEMFTMNSLLYDEYFVYDADSAQNLAKKNISIASELGKKDWEAEWHIKLSFVYAATGMLSESMEELENINQESLPKHLKVELFRQYIYIYSHLGQYLGETEMAKEYYRREAAYKDSICMLVAKDDPLYLWQKAWGPKPLDVKDALVKAIEGSKLDSRVDAMNAYCLSHINEWEGNETERVKYMILSATADVRSCNRDIASLEELAKWLFENGEIDHSYAYINYCMENDRMFHNRVHMVSLNALNNDIHKAYMEKGMKQQQALKWAMICLIVLIVLLVILVFIVLGSMRNVRKSQKEVAEANSHLQSSNMELEEARKNLSELNAQLTDVNSQLKGVNSELLDANYVKEEIIGYVFSICSQYISKQEEFRKRILRQLKTGKIDEIKESVEKPIQHNDLKEFYQTFDKVFLNIYPNFIEDFNNLLRPEERITVKDGELLNTELRIYALVRLGINDSTKISEFLHCSAQTVYNNRLKCRNKSVIAKNEFATTVQGLGKVSRG